MSRVRPLHTVPSDAERKLASRVAPDKIDDMIMVSHGHQDSISFAEHKQNPPLQSNPEFEISAELAKAEPGVNMRFAEGLREQGGGRPDLGLYFGTERLEGSVERWPAENGHTNFLSLPPLASRAISAETFLNDFSSSF